MQLLLNNGTFVNPHEAIIQGLDWWQDRGEKRYFYSKTEFEKYLSKLDNLPVVLAQRHPPKGFRGRNFEDVLKEIDGVEAGRSGKAVINNAGFPKIVTSLDITNPEVDKLIEAGDIDISHTFWFDLLPDGHTLTEIDGDHILLFQRSKGGQQGDPKAIMLNMDDHSNFFNKNEGYGMTNKNEGSGTGSGEDDAMKATIDRLLMNNQETITQQGATIETQKKEIDQLKQLMQNQSSEIEQLKKEISGMKEEKQKSDQALMLNNLFVQGTIEHFKERIDAGELNDPVKSTTLLSEMGTYDRSLEKPQLGGPEGNRYMANKDTPADEEEKETIKTMQEMRSIVGK